MLNDSLRQLGDQNINKLKYFGFLGMRRVNNVVKTSIKKHARVLHSCPSSCSFMSDRCPDTVPYYKSLQQIQISYHHPVLP